jgi:hypothetical protein
MRLPNAEDAQVDAEKLRQYLLSQTHAVGRSKARYFRGVGFDESNLEILEKALVAIAKMEHIVETVSSAHGTKYIVDGSITTPSRDRVKLRTVWIVEKGRDHPRFVTAYPI